MTPPRKARVNARGCSVSDTEPQVERSDEPPDEIDPIATVEAELGRLVHHPREEAARLHAMADDGETASTAFVEMAMVARFVIPLVLLVIGIMVAIYIALK